MRNTTRWPLAFALRLPLFAPDDGGAPPADPPAAQPPAPAAADPAPAAAPPADPPAAAPSAKWFENEKLVTAEDLAFLKAKGLTVEDPVEAAVKAARNHRSAEQFIGKGVDKIIERPAEGQDYGEWARGNAKALGLPETADGYDLAPPESWPKDMPWDSAFEAKFREFAFKSGLPAGAAKAAVGLYAEKIQSLAADADKAYAEANTKMMAELEREYGAAFQSRLAKAKQGAQLVAEKAGLDVEAIQALGGRLAKDIGDAQVIKFMATLGDMLGEDNLVGAGTGGGFGQTKADAEAALAEFMKPDGEFAKASQANDPAAIARLKPKFDALTKAVTKFG